MGPGCTGCRSTSQLINLTQRLDWASSRTIRSFDPTAEEPLCIPRLVRSLDINICRFRRFQNVACQAEPAGSRSRSSRVAADRLVAACPFPAQGRNENASLISSWTTFIQLAVRLPLLPTPYKTGTSRALEAHSSRWSARKRAYRWPLQGAAGGPTGCPSPRGGTAGGF